MCEVTEQIINLWSKESQNILGQSMFMNLKKESILILEILQASN